MLIYVQTDSEIAEDVQRHRLRLPASKQLQELVAQRGLRLEALHPKTRDRNLATYFFISVPTPAIADEVCAALLASGTVEGAYVKPAEGPPS